MINGNSKKFYAILLSILIAINIIGFVAAGLYHVTRHYEIDYGEGIVIYQASQITDRALAYGPINRYPSIIYHYPPVFHLATRAVNLAVGDLLISGRLVSFLSGLFLSAMIGYLTWVWLPARIRPRVRWLAALTAAVIPLTYYNYFWTWLARVDSISLLLGYLALVLFVRLRSSLAGDVLIAALLVGAVFAKHITLAPMAACLLTAVVLDRSRAVRLFISVTVLGGVAFGAFYWFTHGEMLRHLFLYNKNPFSIKRLLSGSFMNLDRVGMIAGVAVAGIVYGFAHDFRRFRPTLSAWVSYVRASRSRQVGVLLTVYCILAAITTMAYGKQGSSVNYFLEWNLSLAPLFVVGLLRWLPSERATRMAPYHILALLMVPYLLLPKPGVDGWLQRFRALRISEAGVVQEQTEIIQILKAAQGDIFSEDMTLLNILGKRIPAEPAIIAALAGSGMWDEQPLIAMIHAHKFSYIVAYDLEFRERWTPAVSEAVKIAYRLDRVIGKYNLYTPR